MKSGLKSPMDFTMSLAQGFHNAPKLYGDTTVRKQERITDLQSGIVAAGKEFGYGFYDGITGLVTQPIQGARKEGAAGFMKGMFRGAFGLVLKPGAAIWGIPGYGFKGIYMEIAKRFGSSTQNYILAARTAQGYQEFASSVPYERETIIAEWKSTQFEMKRGKKKYGKERAAEVESHILVPTVTGSRQELASGFKQTRHLSFDERKELDKRRRALKEGEKDKQRHDRKLSTTGYHHVSGDLRPTRPSQKNAPMSSADLLAASEADFEQAIKRSVTQTSKGNPQEDAVVERALRASVNALRNNPEPITDENQNEAFQRAVQASVREAQKARKDLGNNSQVFAESPVDDSEEESHLARVLTQSLEEQHYGGTNIAMVDNDHDYDTEEDEEYLQAVVASQRSAPEMQTRSVPPLPSKTAGQVTGTTSSRRTDSELHEEELRQALAASLLKEQHNVSANDHNEDDDAELMKALALSEKESKQRTAELEKQRTEEEIVMEYIKKQSLLEEEHRKARGQ